MTMHALHVRVSGQQRSSQERLHGVQDLVSQDAKATKGHPMGEITKRGRWRADKDMHIRHSCTIDSVTRARDWGGEEWR
jgi:hypothetical protein